MTRNAASAGGQPSAATASYQRPVEAALYVHLDNGEQWPVTPTDLEQFRLTDTLAAYMRFRNALAQALRRGGVLDGDLTEARLNPVRYLAEIAIHQPALLDHPEHDSWRDVAELERALQQGNRRADDVVAAAQEFRRRFEDNGPGASTAMQLLFDALDQMTAAGPGSGERARATAPE